MRYLPLTKNDREEMLNTIGVSDIDDLFSSISEKFKSFGFQTVEINGHNLNDIEAAFQSFKKIKKPVIIIANTIKGKGVSFMENNIAWHYKSPNARELKKALKEVNNA